MEGNTNVHHLFGRFQHRALEPLAVLFIINQTTQTLPPYHEDEIVNAVYFMNTCWTITFCDMVQLMEYISQHQVELYTLLHIPQYG